MLTIDYQCVECGKCMKNKDMESMVCNCGGDFKPKGLLDYRPSNFEPYYDKVLRSWVSSYSDQERKAIAHRSPSHPEGLRLANWDRKQINEWKNIARHKEDYKREYETSPETKEKKSFGKTKYFSILFLMFFSTNAFALEGAEYSILNINNKTYKVPIPNRDTKIDFLLLNLAIREKLSGTKETFSLDVILGGLDERWYYIGDVGIVRWLKVTKDGEFEVKEIK